MALGLEHFLGNGGNAQILSSSHDSHFAHVSTDLDSLQPGCHTIKPVSLLQKTTHPWIGNYETTQKCTDIAVLTNTAEPSMCNELYWLFILTVCFGYLVAYLLYACCGALGPFAILLPVIGCWYYMISTGLLADYRSGAMSSEWNYQEGLKGQNVSLQCLNFVSVTYIFTLIIGIYIVFFGLIFGLPYFMLTRMRLETNVRQVITLSDEDKTYLNSAEFKAKCVKAFRDADEDHNGVLDLKELEHIAMFDLTEGEKAHVQESHLFNEAFGKCDADNSKSIDQTEFLEVMKFVWCKAKSKPLENEVIVK